MTNKAFPELGICLRENTVGLILVLSISRLGLATGANQIECSRKYDWQCWNSMLYRYIESERSKDYLSVNLLGFAHSLFVYRPCSHWIYPEVIWMMMD